MERSDVAGHHGSSERACEGHFEGMHVFLRHLVSNSSGRRTTHRPIAAFHAAFAALERLRMGHRSRDEMRVSIWQARDAARTSKPIKLPPDVARAFAKDMRAYFAETNGIKLRLFNVKEMFEEMQDLLWRRWNSAFRSCDCGATF
jgi:hypothetical protein